MPKKATLCEVRLDILLVVEHTEAMGVPIEWYGRGCPLSGLRVGGTHEVPIGRVILITTGEVDSFRFRSCFWHASAENERCG